MQIIPKIHHILEVRYYYCYYFYFDIISQLFHNYFLASQKIFDRKWWDVAAFSIICPIAPVSTKETRFKLSPRISNDENIYPHNISNDSMKTSDEPQHLQLSKGNDREKKKKMKSNTFIEISLDLPAVF